MQIALILPETMSASVEKIAAKINADPSTVCILFIEDGINSYSKEEDIEELKQTLDAEP